MKRSANWPLRRLCFYVSPPLCPKKPPLWVFCREHHSMSTGPRSVETLGTIITTEHVPQKQYARNGAGLSVHDRPVYLGLTFCLINLHNTPDDAIWARPLSVCKGQTSNVSSCFVYIFKGNSWLEHEPNLIPITSNPHPTQVCEFGQVSTCVLGVSEYDRHGQKAEYQRWEPFKETVNCACSIMCNFHQFPCSFLNMFWTYYAYVSSSHFCLCLVPNKALVGRCRRRGARLLETKESRLHALWLIDLIVFCLVYSLLTCTLSHASITLWGFGML